MCLREGGGGQKRRVEGWESVIYTEIGDGNMNLVSSAAWRETEGADGFGRETDDMRVTKKQKTTSLHPAAVFPHREAVCSFFNKIFKNIIIFCFKPLLITLAVKRSVEYLFSNCCKHFPDYFLFFNTPFSWFPLIPSCFPSVSHSALPFFLLLLQKLSLHPLFAPPRQWFVDLSYSGSWIPCLSPLERRGRKQR